MGNFGYICKCCGKNVRTGELCVMKHIRHSEVLGEVTGHYDGYGRIMEEETKEIRFRGNNDTINGHDSICESEFDMEDSLTEFVERVYKEENINFFDFKTKCIFEILMLFEDDVDETGFIAKIKKYTSENPDEKFLAKKTKYLKSNQFVHDCKEKFERLPLVVHSTYSGIAVWHKKCYDETTEENKADVYPSKQDVHQSWGEPRKQYL